MNKAVWAWVLIALIILLAYVMRNRDIENRLATIEVLRSGTPIHQLLNSGYRPYSEGEITYKARKARFYRFRSSAGFGGPKSLDFGVVVNEHGIIEAVVYLSDDIERKFWQSLTGERI